MININGDDVDNKKNLKRKNKKIIEKKFRNLIFFLNEEKTFKTLKYYSICHILHDTL